jgi:hypothetical protein
MGEKKRFTHRFHVLLEGNGVYRDGLDRLRVCDP